MIVYFFYYYYSYFYILFYHYFYYYYFFFFWGGCLFVEVFVCWAAGVFVCWAAVVFVCLFVCLFACKYNTILKPSYTFGTGKKVHWFTNNLEFNLLKCYSMKCFSFWENIKTIINSRYRELQLYFKYMSWLCETYRNKGGFSQLFSPDSDDRLSLNFHRFVILYRTCDIRSVGL